MSTSNYVENLFSAVDNKGAMLDLLAAAAAVVSGQKLTQEDEAAIATSSESPSNKKLRLRTPGTGLRKMSAKQLQSLSANQLINLFALLDGDEIKKTFYYRCKFSPVCSKRFYSFGSEDKARLLIKDHLLKHVKNLKPDLQVDTPQKGEKLNIKSQRKNSPSVTVKIVKKTDKPSSIMADSTSPPSDDFPALDPPSTPLQSYAFSAANTLSPPPPPPLPSLQVPSTPVVSSCESDHDYNCRPPLGVSVPYPLHSAAYPLHSSPPSETVIIDFNADQKTIILRESPFESQMNHSNIIQQEVIDDWLPVCHEEVVVSTEQEVFDTTEENDFQMEEIKTEVIDPSYETPSVDCDKTTFPKERKPKGKAKFIGQSDAEKEMAMQMIKSVRKKQMLTDKLECQICKPPRLFTAPTTLISHYRSHAGIKPFECMVCKAVFTRQHSLNYHLLIHMNQTRFTCEVCGRKFRHPSHFKEHQRRHTGEAPFHCQDCSLRFKTRNTYKRHLKTRHGKVLTQSGGITLLSEEEFRRVRTCPRQRPPSRPSHPHSPHLLAHADKENTRTQASVKVEGGGSRLGAANSVREMMEPQSLATSITVNLPMPIGSADQQATIMLLSPNNHFNINHYPTQKHQVAS